MLGCSSFYVGVEDCAVFWVGFEGVFCCGEVLDFSSYVGEDLEILEMVSFIAGFREGRFTFNG